MSIGETVKVSNGLASSAPDTINTGAGDDTIGSGGGKDTIDAGAGNDSVNAGANRDSVKGRSGDDVLYGQGSNDRVKGGAGNDYVDGGGGNDRVYGGYGEDIIRGGNGDDILSATTNDKDTDGDKDIFIFDNSDGSDLVYGFEVGIDKIYLVDNDGSASFSLNAGGSTVMTYGTTVVTFYNVDLTGGATYASDAEVAPYI